MPGAGRSRRPARPTRCWPAYAASWGIDGLIGITAAGAHLDRLAEQGDIAGMVAVFDEVVDVVRALYTEFFGARIRLSAIALGHLADAAQAAPAAERAGLAARREELVDAWRAWRRRPSSTSARSVRRGGPGWPGSSAEQLRLRWLAGVEPPPVDELVEAWREAVACVRVTSATPSRRPGRAAAWPTCSTPRGAADEARAVLAAAREIADRARAPSRCWRTLGACARRHAARRRSRRAGVDLTPRESEVLALVAEGAATARWPRRCSSAPRR